MVKICKKVTNDIAGIELSNNNSKMYILTGARETNASFKTEVIDGLKAKHLIPIYILTGNCSRQSQEELYGKKIRFFSFFLYFGLSSISNLVYSLNLE